MKKNPINIIGGGLAGSEAALFLSKHGVKVNLFEMRPEVETSAHKTGLLGELICSNSLKSNRLDTGGGLLKAELNILESSLLKIAEENQVKSGAALTVDRESFSEEITRLISESKNITLIREEITNPENLDGPILIASGPLTSAGLSGWLKSVLGEEHLYFYDAISPIISWESINHDKGFFESRYGKGSKNIFNLPMSETEYKNFWTELTNGEVAPLKEVDKLIYFESCLPVEEIARRGIKSLLFGPLRPVGFEDPKAKGANAVLQLRPESPEGQFFNLIGFQTRLKYGEQKRIFRLVPGLEEVEFIRFGSMHRNTFINSPAHLKNDLQFKKFPGIYLAGQISGVEGYIESIMSGLIAGISILSSLNGIEFTSPPPESMIGAILKTILTYKKNFQPINANFGLVPALITKIKNKKERRTAQAERALRTLKNWRDGFVKKI